MKLILCLLVLSLNAFAQNLSPEEQKKLLEENAALKAQLQNLQSPDAAQSQALMEKLRKGQKHMEESNKYLEELDKEE